MEFLEREFESDDKVLFTFQGHNGSFCINLSGVCVHSVKTLSSHLKKLNELVNKFNLIETK